VAGEVLSNKWAAQGVLEAVEVEVEVMGQASPKVILARAVLVALVT
jgi:hypothetical protein